MDREQKTQKQDRIKMYEKQKAVAGSMGKVRNLVYLFLPTSKQGKQGETKKEDLKRARLPGNV